MFKPFANRPFIKKFLISYFVVLLIPILLNVLTFSISLTFAERYANKSNTALINQIRFSLDQRFRALEMLVYQLSQERKLDSLSKQRAPFYPGFHFDLNSVLKKIQPFMLLENNIANDYFVVLNDNGFASDGYTFITEDYFFGSRFRYSNWDHQDWEKFLTGSYHKSSFLPCAEIFNGMETFRGIIMVKTIPFYFNSSNSAFVIFTIREEELFSYYYPENVKWQGRPVLYEKGSMNILAGDDDSYNGQAVNIESFSDDYDIAYGLSVPYEDIFNELLQVRWLMILINILIIILSFMVAFFLSKANANPLFALYNLLKNSTSDVEVGRSGFDLLNGSVTKLISTNESLQSRLAMQKQVIRDEFFYRLVRHGFDTPGELEAVREYVDLTLPEGQSGILLMCLPMEPSKKSRSLKISIIEMLKQISVFPDFWLELDNHQIGYIYCLEKNEKEEWFQGLHEEIVRFNKVLSIYIDIPYFWTIGNPDEAFFHLNTSYRQAKIVADELLEYQNSGYYEYRGFIKNSSNHSLPIDIVQKIYNLTRSGEVEMSLSLFRQNWQQNIGDGALSRRHQQIYFLELRSLLSRIDPGFIDTVEFFDFHLKDHATVCKLFSSVIIRAGNRAGKVGDRLQSQLKDRLLKYLKENFDNKNITLSYIATKFEKSESYISHIYKRCCGKNFYSLLEELRMDKAKELLGQSNISIQEVADSTGYSSMHSFRRAFKKIFGISPSSYRNAV